jgi:serine/threonine protein phosphatase PrpC
MSETTTVAANPTSSASGDEVRVDLNAPLRTPRAVGWVLVIVLQAFLFSAGESLTLAAGDVLLLYTDGVTEAKNAAGDDFGKERLAGVISANRARTVHEISDAILAEVSAFRQAAPASDDLTFVVIRANES